MYVQGVNKIQADASKLFTISLTKTSSPRSCFSFDTAPTPVTPLNYTVIVMLFATLLNASFGYNAPNYELIPFLVLQYFHYCINRENLYLCL